jgi:hypothetical protein
MNGRGAYMISKSQKPINDSDVCSPRKTMEDLDYVRLLVCRLQELA